MNTYMCTFMNTYMFTYMNNYLHTSMFACTYTSMCILMYLNLHVYVHVYLQVYLHLNLANYNYRFLVPCCLEGTFERTSFRTTLKGAPQPGTRATTSRWLRQLGEGEKGGGGIRESPNSAKTLKMDANFSPSHSLPSAKTRWINFSLSYVCLSVLVVPPLVYTFYAYL